MPLAPLRQCAKASCSQLVVRGYCPDHQRTIEQRRGTAHQRGYSYFWSAIFRPYYLSRLVDLQIPPVCGARLPNGPSRTDLSQCQRQGLLTGTNLQLHHEPPLEDWERSDRARVCDERRIVVLCATCHAAVR
jgi:hypothetical protein